MLVDITSNTFYKCTATFRTHCTTIQPQLVSCCSYFHLKKIVCCSLTKDPKPWKICQLWTEILFDMINFVNCNWVDTQWLWYSKHWHTNSTQNNTMKQNTQNGIYITIRIHKHNNFDLCCKEQSCPNLLSHSHLSSLDITFYVALLLRYRGTKWLWRPFWCDCDVWTVSTVLSAHVHMVF
jgi:hypothetical protein